MFPVGTCFAPRRFHFVLGEISLKREKPSSNLKLTLIGGAQDQDYGSIELHKTEFNREGFYLNIL